MTKFKSKTFYDIPADLYDGMIAKATKKREEKKADEPKAVEANAETVSA
jgi:hypothetical protein